MLIRRNAHGRQGCGLWFLGAVTGFGTEKLNGLVEVSTNQVWPIMLCLALTCADVMYFKTFATAKVQLFFDICKRKGKIMTKGYKKSDSLHSESLSQFKF